MCCVSFRVGSTLAFVSQVSLVCLWLWVVAVLYNAQKSEACPRAKEMETWLLVDAVLGFFVICLSSVQCIKAPLVLGAGMKQSTIAYFLVDGFWGLYGVHVLSTAMLKDCQKTGGTLFFVLCFFVLSFCVLSFVTLAFVGLRSVNAWRKARALAVFKSRMGRGDKGNDS